MEQHNPPQVAADATAWDPFLVDIADYASAAAIESPEAYRTARLCLMDSLGCALAALEYPQCTKVLGPLVPGAVLPGGARVPGTAWELETGAGPRSLSAR